MPISSPSTPRPASRRGRRRSSTTPTDTSSPRRPWSSRARSSSASPGPVRWARAASSRPSTPTPGRASGAGTRSPPPASVAARRGPRTRGRSADRVTGKGVETPGLRPTMGGPPVEVCPSLLGGTGWQPKVYNPRTGLLYIPSNEFCMKYGYVPDLTYKKGQLFTGNTTEHFSKTEHAGVLRAFDVNQNKVLWEWNNRTPLISHTLATAGDLVFQGTAEGKVIALNAKDGQELWSFNLGTTQSGGIISYAVDGKQYIAVAAGGTVRSQVWFGKEPKWADATKLNFSDVVVVFGLSE